MESILETSKALIIFAAILGGGLLFGCICGGAVGKAGELLPESTLNKLGELWSAILTIGVILMILLGLWGMITDGDSSSSRGPDDPQGPFYRGQEY